MRVLLVVAALVATSAAFSVKAADPVKVGVYDESYCPFCREFSKDQLGPTYKELSDIMDVHLCSYGWATEKPDGDGYTFDCQHGPEECEGNKILGCANKYITVQEDLVNYFVCFMSGGTLLKEPYRDAEKCATGDINWSDIEKCAKSDEGEKLAHDAGVEFNNLKPMPNGVPYITIDGKGNDNANGNLKKVVCNAYTGEKPAACS